MNKLSWYLVTKLKIAKTLPKDNELPGYSVVDFINKVNTHEICMVIPQGNDGSINHAITVGNGMIFDATQDYPLTITRKSLDFNCGDCGCCGIYKTRSFTFINKKSH